MLSFLKAFRQAVFLSLATSNFNELPVIKFDSKPVKNDFLLKEFITKKGKWRSIIARPRPR